MKTIHSVVLRRGSSILIVRYFDNSFQSFDLSVTPESQSMLTKIWQIIEQASETPELLIKDDE